ncbi:MAG: N-6 DNA methylase [Bdellovibrionales bacterium]|nr:N-6 DNA methylase [Bdellovibrionales bacterium]
MSENYVLKEHREWITSLQPVGLVVSANALEHAQLRLQKDVFEAQETFKSLLDPKGQLLPLRVVNLFTRFLGWRQEDLASGDDIRDLQAYLPERETLLKPDHAVRNIDTGEFDILVKYVDSLQFDANEEVTGRAWDASPHTKFERLLREKNISLGILINNNFLRIVYSPKGETSGYMTFPFAFMREVQGRPILAGLKLLLGEDRLFKGDPKQRLQYLLTESRKFQNDVSTKLSQQVLAALYELIRGFQAAHEETKGKLLKNVLKEDKNEVYHGLLTVLLRTVFTLYAEDRDLISSDPVFLNNYSINGLFTKLREDFSKHHDSMDLRYGAWAHLLSLYRLIYDGIELETDSIPGRKGHLFDPDRFPFLEGRTTESPHFNPPKISDGVVWRVLSNLMTLDGERISYRALDVEQIGSVYETVMGFQLEIATGPSIAIKPAKSHGAPVVVNLNEILHVTPAKRTAKLKELTDNKFEGRIGDAIKSATNCDELVSALGTKVADWATRTVVEKGAMILQPSDARRRSGSHYTPRSLTAPIVTKALGPTLDRLGKNPTPEQILALKVCDPAMGSGAFLVEACRQLSEILVKSWAIHTPNIRNKIPLDEDELLYARRMIAQRCLYGVDKNPMAVNLAKLSLWLATFAKQHEFTFLDHCLKCGDSLVGLSISQILAITWESGPNPSLPHASIAQRLNRVREIRSLISTSADNTPVEQLHALKLEEDVLLNDLRCIGDAVIYTFFAKDKLKSRKEELARIQIVIEAWFASGIPFTHFKGLDHEISWLRNTQNLKPFHWECEFPEVFQNPSNSSEFGFDIFVGNPPFAGRSTISIANGEGFIDWLKCIHVDSHGNSDLVAHFFRRAFNLLNGSGCLGFIATNTIAQGDTRESGLGWICQNNGTIYCAIKRLRWPGQAAVVVSVVWLSKSNLINSKFIDNRQVENITAFLFSGQIHSSPVQLLRNQGTSFQGCVVVGTGFTFAEDSGNKSSTSFDQMHRIIEKDKRNNECIFPYIGGEDVNTSPKHENSRYIINFGEMSESDARQKYPDLISIVEEKVRPEREKDGKRLSPDQAKRAEKWWQFARTAIDLYSSIKKQNLTRVIVTSQVSKHRMFTFLPSDWVFDQRLIVITQQKFCYFATLQSTVHEVWARFFGSTMKDDLSYTPTDCFETFPFPQYFEQNTMLEEIGREYFEFRRDLMIKSNEGMTKIYNRFHDSSENTPDIIHLRKLHNQLDEAVLSAYGWSDFKPIAEFLADFDDEDGDSPTRLRWSDSDRDQILGRLMDLNARYAAQQAMQGDEQ